MSSTFNEGGFFSRSSDLESLMVRKLIASTPFDSAGMIWSVSPGVHPAKRLKPTGGVMCLNNPQLTVANHLCCFTSLAPELDPSRLCSSLIKSFRIADLHRLVTGTLSGNATSFFNTLANVAFLLGPLKGVVANYESAPVSLTPTHTHNHLVNQNAQSPPVHSRSVSTTLDDLWSDVLLGTDKGVGSEIRNATSGVHQDRTVRTARFDAGRRTSRFSRLL